MATLTIADLDNGKRDLETVDAVANSQADTTPTRYGQQTLTLAGALRRLGWQAPVPYAPGLVVDRATMTVERDGIVYRPDPALVPFTTGAWNPDQWRVLQNTPDTNQVYQFPTLPSAESAAATLPDGAAVIVEGQSVGHANAGEYARDSAASPASFTDYADLRAYRGKNSHAVVLGPLVGIEPSGISGPFVRVDADTSSPDDNGITIIDALGRRWRRVFDTEILTSWYQTADHTAVQKAINKAYSKRASVLINEHQTWTAPVVLKNGVKLRGLGVDIFGGGTHVQYTGTTDALVMQNAINTSTSTNIDIEGIWFSSGTLANNCGMIFDTASSVLKIRKCRFNAKIGIILDQTEMSDIYDCSFAIGGGPEHCGVWIVNGPDKNPGAQPFWTNRLSVKGCEFNGGVGSVAIYDDGGISHVFEDNNYNACGSHIIATAVNSIRIQGGEWEVNSAPAIIFSLNKRIGSLGAKCNTVSVQDAYYYHDGGIPFIAAVPGSIGHINFENNFVNCPGIVFSGAAVSCDSIHAQGNKQLGAGDGTAIINNYYDNVPATTNWAAEGSAPILGDGVIAAAKSRKGREVTYRLLLSIGAGTSGGSGAWKFGLPHKANTNAAGLTVGSAYALIPGNAGYSAATSITDDGQWMQIKVSNPTPNAGAGVPTAWVAWSTLRAQITYEADAPI